MGNIFMRTAVKIFLKEYFEGCIIEVSSKKYIRRKEKLFSKVCM